MGLNVVKAETRGANVFEGREHRSAASADAVTDIAEFILWKDRRANASTGGRTVTDVRFTPDPGATSVTASNTNYWTMTLKKYAEGGGSATTVASITTKAAGSNGLVALKTAILTIVATAADLAAGDILTLTIAHSGTPNAVFPTGLWLVDTSFTE